MTPRPLRSRLLLPGLVVVLATGCSTGGPAAAPAGAPGTPPAAAPTSAPPPDRLAETAPAEAPTITITGFEYDVPASVRAGTEVQVVNEDREAHTVTLSGGGPSVVVPGGATATLTAPAEAGSYRVGCQFHGGMTAELVVG